MTKTIASERAPGSPYVVTRDILSSQVSGEARLAVPVSLNAVGPGIFTDTVTWNATSGLVLGLGLSVANSDLPLVGGTAVVEINALAQAEYSGVDGWVAATPVLRWIAGQAPFLITDLLGGVPIATIATPAVARIRLITTSVTDSVDLKAMVTPVAANPSCP